MSNYQKLQDEYEAGIKQAEADLEESINEPTKTKRIQTRGLTKKQKSMIIKELLRQARELKRFDITEDWFEFIDEPLGHESSDSETDVEDVLFETKIQPTVKLPRVDQEATRLMKIKEEKDKELEVKMKEKIFNYFFENMLNLNWQRVDSKPSYNFDTSSRNIIKSLNDTLQKRKQARNAEAFSEVVSNTYDKLDQLVESNREGQKKLVNLMKLVKDESDRIKQECKTMSSGMADEMVRVGQQTISIVDGLEHFKTDIFKMLNEQFLVRGADLKEIKKQKAVLNEIVEEKLYERYEQVIDPGLEDLQEQIKNLKTTTKPSHSTTKKTTAATTKVLTPTTKTTTTTMKQSAVPTISKPSTSTSAAAAADSAEGATAEPPKRVWKKAPETQGMRNLINSGLLAEFEDWYQRHKHSLQEDVSRY